jgi:acetyl-CoA carboxylase carboxyl transferase subunit beta
MLFNVELEYMCRLSKSIDNHVLENISVSEDPILNNIKKNTYNWSHNNNSNVDHLVIVRDIQNLNMYDTFLVLDRGNKKIWLFHIF